MYHIKPDKRVLASVQQITAGLAACLESKPFEHITITDIQRASSVGRATFYRIFDSTVDVLAYQCDQLFQTLLPSAKQIPQTDAEVVTFIKRVMAYDDFLETLIASHHLEVLYAAHQKRVGVLLRDLKRVDTADQYALGVSSAMMMGALTTWLARGKRENAQDLLAFMKQTIQRVSAYGLR